MYVKLLRHEKMWGCGSAREGLAVSASSLALAWLLLFSVIIVADYLHFMLDTASCAPASPALASSASRPFALGSSQPLVPPWP